MNRFDPLLAALLIPLISFPGAASPVGMSGSDIHQQSFDTLPPAGTSNEWINDSTLAAWVSSRTLIIADAGSSTSGGQHSYGGAGDTERALGSLASGGADPVTWGVVLHNADPAPLEIISISYTGEQWRDGGGEVPNRLSFAFATRSSPIESTDVTLPQFIPALDFTAPIISGSSGALDGNAAANRVEISATTQIIVAPDEYVILLWTDPNDPGNDQGLAIDDLTVEWAPSSGIDTVPPLVTSRFPADDSSDLPFPVIRELSLIFSESIMAGSGDIQIRRTDDESTVLSIDVDDPLAFFIFDNEAFITLPDPSPFEAGTDYHVIIPEGGITDLSGNPFAGFTTSSAWGFATAPHPATPSVVVNKYANGQPDLVELLAIGNQSPGGTLDLRGMILKDFSGSVGTDDGGGKYQFTPASLWHDLPVGTLVVVRADDPTSSDVDPSDFVVRVGLEDPLYFTQVGSGGFNISGSDLIMIKAAGSPPEGVSGGIHALGGGEAGPLFDFYPGNKLLAPLGGAGVCADNPGSAIEDFNGTNASGGKTFAATDFGIPHNGSNAAFIATLRGRDPGDGDGSAFVINASEASPFLGRGFFKPGQADRTARLVLHALAPGVTLTDITLEIPGSLGIPADVTLDGPGASGSSLEQDGATITITSASVTREDALEVTIAGLSTPADPGDFGTFPIALSTRASGGVLAPIAIPPAVRTVIPIASIRELDESGVALASGRIVAIEGICTEEDFGPGGENFSGFLQQGSFGVNVFSALDDPGLIRGHHFAALGMVSQFSGLTEIVPADAADVVDLGPETEPTPVSLTADDLLANAEAHEGRLVTVAGLSPSGDGIWAPASNLTLQDAAGNTLEIRIQAGSGATAEPAYPATITGVFGQFDTVAPFHSGYQLMPRDPADIVPAEAGDDAYSRWALARGLVTGLNDEPEADAETGGGDGLANVLEFVLGGHPLESDPQARPATELVDTHFIFSFLRDDSSEGLVTLSFEWLPQNSGLDFSEPKRVPIESASSGDPFDPVNAHVEVIENGDAPDLIRVKVPRPLTHGLFGRLKATRP